MERLIAGGLTHVHMGCQGVGDEEGLINMSKRMKPEAFEGGAYLKKLGLSFDFDS